MDSQHAAASLAQILRSGRLVALVGSGASADYTDLGGRRYTGLLTPGGFAELVARSRPYVAPGLGFEGTCTEIRTREGRPALEALLLEHYRRPRTVEIPQAHQILAWLPFASYMTSNYDQFLEWKLEAEGRQIAVVVENEDLANIGRGSAPVVKYHGCVSRPRTMVAATDDYDNARISERTNLVRDLIKVNLARSNLLVIGHGLADVDLIRLMDELLRGLGTEYIPTIYIIREPERAGEPLDLPFQVELVFEDLTRFLSRMLHEYRATEHGAIPTAPIFEESWLDSAFFTQIRQVSFLPTETQVIDAFLIHLADEFAARTDVAGVTADAGVAVANAIAERPNYEALKTTWDNLRPKLETTSDTATGEETVREAIDLRNSKTTLFRAVGRKYVRRNDRLLLFSQSQRVLQALLGVSAAVQRTVDLFIAECRPKSPYPYDDATAICRLLADSHYNITVCPDVVATNLISTGQIDRIIMGTHAVYTEDGLPHSFVNTCGSLAVALAGERYSVPTLVIAELIKLKAVAAADAIGEMHSHQERDLLEAATGINELATRRSPVSHINIGYDLVPVSDLITVEVADDVAGS